MQEEQQGDAQLGDDADALGGEAASGQHGGYGHRADHHQQIGIESKAGEHPAARHPQALTRNDNCRSDALLRPSAISRSSRRVGYSPVK